MALRLEAKAVAYGDDDASTATAATDDGSSIGKNAAATQLTMATAPAAGFSDDDEDDELFELDIALLDGRHHQGRRSSAGFAEENDADGHALLANCLLPARSVSRAVPVDAGSALSSSSYPYSGYHSSRRRLVCTAASRRFLVGRLPGSSARFCFSSRGFETMGNCSYFQRY